MKYADVIVPLAVAGLYTYEIPEEMEEECKVGKRVMVQFGKKKYYTAIVRNIHNRKPLYETKAIFSIIDKNPIINILQLEFWEWIASYYMCQLGEVYTAAVPVSLRIESQTQIFLNENFVETEISDKERKIIEQLKEQKTLTISQIEKKMGVSGPLSLVNKMIKKGIVGVYEHFKTSYKPKFKKCVCLSENIATETDLNVAFEKLSRAKRQKELLEKYIELSELKFVGADFIFLEVEKDILLKSAEANYQTLKSLYAKGILNEYQKRVSRLESYRGEELRINKLTDIQKVVYDQILDIFEKKDVVLFYGITSSGKTEIYIHLIRRYLEQNKQVLYLLPEIALTTQIIERLRIAFGDLVGVYHSKFNDSERAEIWEKVNEASGETEFGRYRIILGVRSAIFLPFTSLGLIIVDEEHENTYKQFDPAPRYNARDSAIVLAKKHNAKVLLGTATPAIESYYNAKTGKYGYVELKKRHQEIELPEILIADVAEARRKREMKSIFHPLMLEHISAALSSGEQIILFQNRRGFSPYVQCRVCSWIPRCEHCDVSLTYHAETNELVCHYCGFKRSVPTQCEECGEFAIETRGFGTERLEDEIKIFFPEVKVGRLDLDIARRKYGYENVLHSFDTGNIDILVGTQMITKGLDFKNVSLVGVLDADTLLNFPDFRSYERTYQLLTQVSGRAGRMNARGKVVIQTSLAHHKVLQFVLENNFEDFYKEEIYERQQFKYPPFVRMIKITFRHKKQEVVEKFSNLYASRIIGAFGQSVLGPYFPLIKRIQNYYLKEILIKLESNMSLEKSKKFLIQTSANLKNQPNFSNVMVSFNVDPY
jgi:primosomal protein N' (replication factor Y)